MKRGLTHFFKNDAPVFMNEEDFSDIRDNSLHIHWRNAGKKNLDITNGIAHEYMIDMAPFSQDEERRAKGPDGRFPVNFFASLYVPEK